MQKVVLQTQKYSSSTDALKELHWLPIRLTIQYKIYVLVFKCKHKEAPTYLQELLTPKLPSRVGLRSESTNYLDYEILLCNRKTFKERFFAIQGPKFWNSLPYCLKEMDSIDSF